MLYTVFEVVVCVTRCDYT